MELVYRNDYGASFRVKNIPNTRCTLQLVVDSIGLFMTEDDMENLLKWYNNLGKLVTAQNAGANIANAYGAPVNTMNLVLP